MSGLPDQVDEPIPADLPGILITPATDEGIERLAANAAVYAEATMTEELPATPALKVAIVTCMDCRFDPAAVLGLANGEAHVLRNAGGVITDDMVRSLSISQHKLGTREVMLIHHTRCGMQTITDDGFRAELWELTGTTPPFAVESFTDLDADVRQSILRVRRSEFVPHTDAVRGFVYDVDTHGLREVSAVL